MRQKITKPKQAGSPRTLDRMQIIVQGALTDLDTLASVVDAMTFKDAAEYRRYRDTLARARSRLRGLLRSVEKAERR